MDMNKLNFKYATSIYVALLYAVFITTLVVGFASYISRVNLSNELSDAKVGSLDKVIFLNNREENIQTRLVESRDALFEVQTELLRLREQRDSLDSEIYQKTANLIDQFIPISTAISIYGNALDPAFVKYYRDLMQESDTHYFELAKRLSVALSTVQYQEFAAAESVTEFTAVVEDVQKKLADARVDLQKTEATFRQLRQKEHLVERNIDEIQNLIQDDLEELSKIDEGISNDQRALIASFKNSFAEIFYSLLQIPTIILTLIVTIAAGGLGSVVAFTKNFATGTERATSGLLFVNVGEGVAAAVAVFLFASAGMLTLTQNAGGAQGAIELTPYTVAFIAFVSGFMAEDAFTRIQIAGKRIFQAP